MGHTRNEYELTDKHLRDLISHRQISEQLHRYCFYFDSNYPDGLRSLFTEDAIVDYGPEVQTLYGIDEIINSISLGLSNTFEATSHHISNIVINFTSASEASVKSYIYAWHKYKNKSKIGHLWGQYSHTFKMENDQWLIAKLTLQAVAVQDFHRSAMHAVYRHS